MTRFRLGAMRELEGYWSKSDVDFTRSSVVSTDRDRRLFESPCASSSGQNEVDDWSTIKTGRQRTATYDIRDSAKGLQQNTLRLTAVTLPHEKRA